MEASQEFWPLHSKEGVMNDTRIFLLIRKCIGSLIAVSGATHLTQSWSYSPEQSALFFTTVVSGLVLLCVGLYLLLRESRLLLWLVLVVNAVAVLPHAYGLLFMGSTPITVFHFAVACLLIPASAYLLFSKRKAQTV